MKSLVVNDKKRGFYFEFTGAGHAPGVFLDRARLFVAAAV
jgi:hypothetical protein